MDGRHACPQTRHRWTCSEVAATCVPCLSSEEPWSPASAGWAVPASYSPDRAAQRPAHLTSLVPRSPHLGCWQRPQQLWGRGGQGWLRAPPWWPGTACRQGLCPAPTSLWAGVATAGGWHGGPAPSPRPPQTSTSAGRVSSRPLLQQSPGHRFVPGDGGPVHWRTGCLGHRAVRGTRSAVTTVCVQPAPPANSDLSGSGPRVT